jgi:hypothetical protein
MTILYVTCFLYESSEISMLFTGGPEINEVDPDSMSLFNYFFRKSHFVYIYIHRFIFFSFVINTECPTCYRTRHFFNNSNTNDNIATKQTHTLQTHSYSFLTQRTYSCSNFVAISSLMLELLKKCRVR